MDYTQDIAEAKQATSPAELKEFAATKGLELTDEKAAEYFEKLQGLDALAGKELVESELASVAGGIPPKPYPRRDDAWKDLA